MAPKWLEAININVIVAIEPRPVADEIPGLPMLKESTHRNR